MRSEDVLRSDLTPLIDTQTNATATATVAARPNLAFYITRVVLSAGGAIAASVAAEIRSGATPLLRITLPTGIIAPVVLDFDQRPLEVPRNTVPSVVLPALGAGIPGTVSVLGFFGAPST